MLILLTRIAAYLRLGWRSLWDVALYQVGLKTGLHPVLRITPLPAPSGSFFVGSSRQGPLPSPTPAWQGMSWAFGQPCDEATDTPPNWHANILTGTKVRQADKRWDKVRLFSTDVGDIKTIWEASRFDWLLAFAQNAAIGKPGALDQMNTWLNDWVQNNPAYLGPNWICGQEASIRIAHIFLSATLLGTKAALSPPLETLLLLHLRRIAPTTAYARGQNNNHATSEAMALYVGGLWILHCGENSEHHAEARKYVRQGLRLAEERVRALIFDDGGFAQYSHVYHRLMLDSLSVMELARRQFGAPEFSSEFIKRAANASKWLRCFTNPTNGDVPNMGSNDGAWLLPIGPSAARDFRPSCALASTLFEGATAFGDASGATSLLRWLNVEPLAALPEEARPQVQIFYDSAIAVINHGDWTVYVRLPGTKFRPHQADALHMDVWRGGKNLLGDAGSYSYAAEGWNYFPSTAAHNTIEFDGRDQMPRVGRFLYGRWLRRGDFRVGDRPEKPSVTASYTDYRGATHQRTVSVTDDEITVQDSLSGRFDTAKIRWRIMPDSAGLEVASADMEYSDEDSIHSTHYLAAEDAKGKIGHLRKAGVYKTKISIK